MKKSLLCFLLVMISLGASAQVAPFSKVFYDSTFYWYNLSSSGVVSTFDNGYLISGNRDVYTGGLLMKVDSGGNLKWNKTYSFTQFKGLIKTNDSCFLAYGTYSDTAGNADGVFCVKVNSVGDTVWTSSVSKTNYYFSVYGAQQTSDSGFVITGSASNNQILVSKINKSGVLLWSVFIDGGTTFCEGYSVKEMPGGYALTGVTQNFDEFHSLSFLLKLSPAGVPLWAYKYDAGSYSSSGNDVIVLNNGLLLFCSAGGYTYLLKTDFSGNILWQKQLATGVSNGSGYGLVPKLRKTSANDYLLVGGPCSEAYMVRIDTLGNALWSNYYQIEAADVTETRDKGMFIVGQGPVCRFRSSTYFGQQMGIIKTDSLGMGAGCGYSTSPILLNDSLTQSLFVVTTASGTHYSRVNVEISTLQLESDTGCVPGAGAVKENSFEFKIELYPNPASQKLTIQFSDDNKKNICILDLSGKIIKQVSSKNTETTFDINDLSNGLYFARVTSLEGIKTVKFVVQH